MDIKTKVKSYGFTLIELLVVTAILALLAAVILVSMRSLRQDARITTLQSDAVAIQKQIDIARIDNGTPLRYIVGNCPGCGGLPGVKMNDQPPWVTEGLEEAWQAVGFSTSPRDPWGSQFVIHVKEDGDYCWQPDQIISAGEDQIVESYFLYSTEPPGILSVGAGDDYLFSITYYGCVGWDDDPF